MMIIRMVAAQVNCDGKRKRGGVLDYDAVVETVGNTAGCG